MAILSRRVMLRRNQILLVYDGTCGFCSGVARVVSLLDWRQRVRTLPFQTQGFLNLTGIDPGLAARTALVLSPSGRLWREGGAVVATLDELLPFGLPFFRTLYYLPGVHQLADFLYRFAARNRRWLGFLYPPDLRRHDPPQLDDETRKELARRRLASHMPSALPGPPLTIH